MVDLKSLRHFCSVTKPSILERGALWAKLLLLPQNDPEREQIKLALVNDPKIKKIVNRLDHPKLGVSSLWHTPADYRIYGSFYWGLRFLADLGLKASEWGMDNLIHQLQLQQLEDGQFMIRYHRKKQQTISLICMTAHLAYCLVRLGYQQTNTVHAALDYILTTQRHDGGWHCDRLKQQGERDEAAPSCPAATIHVIRLLAQYGKTYRAVVKPCLNSLVSAINQTALSGCELDGQQDINWEKLRYPPHYTGLDILNLIHSLSFFPDLFAHSNFDQMVAAILKRWDGTHWLRAEKRIPEWSDFDFSQPNKYSEWLTSLFLQAIERSYF